MRKKLIAGMCITFLATSSFSTSLRDSVEKALNNNPDIIAERKNQEAYRKYVDERKGLYLPTLDIESYLQRSGETKKYKNNRLDDKSYEDGYNASIILRQYVYDGGSTPAQVAETKFQEQANKYRSLYAIENTILETVKAYTDLVQFDERLLLSEGMIKVHEKNLVTAKEKEEISGEVLETYQVSSKLNFVTNSYIEEQDLKDTGVARYIKYVGEKPEGRVCRPVIDETKVPSTLKDALRIAVLQNHRILEQIERIKLQREKIAQYDANFLPRLNLELKASIDDDLELKENGNVEDWHARLNFNWNLFNGNRDKIRSEQEAIFLQEQKKTLDEITNDVVAEVKSLYGKFFKNKKRIEALKQYVNANVNIVDVYKNEFEAGTRTFVDILDAENELYSSSKGLISMEYAALNNYYSLMFNLSMLSEAILASSNQDCATVKPRTINYTPEKQNKTSKSDLDDLISITDSEIISKELGLESSKLGRKASSKKSYSRVSSSNYKSFLDAPKNYFTINLATFKTGMGAANSYIRENNLEDNAFAFQFGANNRNTKVLYGVYSSAKEARAAIETLGNEVLAGKPYVDNINKHQALYAKYN